MTRAGYRASAESALMRTHPWLIPATAGLITVVTALAVPNRAHAGPDAHLSRAESESVRRVAEDAEAMNRLGVLYAEGRGVSRDYSAARGGAADAQNKLGALYSDGLGVVKDQKRALELFRQAAMQGYPPAMVNLGRMYIEAIAVARDVVRGYALIRAAVDAGIPASLQELALRELGTAAGRLDAEQLARAQALASSSLCGIEQRAVGESAGIRRQDCPVDLAGPHDVQNLESLREQVVADDATMATPS